MSVYEPAREALVFGRYLLRRNPSEEAVRLYTAAMAARPVPCSKRDEKIIAFVLRRPGLLATVDAGLAFSKQRSALREKLLVMTAILETQPEYAELYLPQQRASGYWIVTGFQLCGSVFRLIAGKLILRFL